MAYPVKSLYRRIERALETIALGAEPLQTITSTASMLVDTVFAAVSEFSAQTVPSDDQTVAVIRRGRTDAPRAPRHHRSPQ